MTDPQLREDTAAAFVQLAQANLNTAIMVTEWSERHRLKQLTDDLADVRDMHEDHIATLEAVKPCDCTKHDAYAAREAEQREAAEHAPLADHRVREQQCLVSKSCTGPHEWWFTSSGGGHQLAGAPDSHDFKTERGLTRYRCPGPREVVQAEPDPLDESIKRGIAQAAAGDLVDLGSFADPLDESDHRDRLDRDGGVIRRKGNKRWAWPDQLGFDAAAGSPLTALNASYGPLTFAPDTAPQATGDDLSASEGESGSVEGGGADDSSEAILCPECGHGLHSHMAAIGCWNPLGAPDCGCENTATDIARALIAEAAKAERLRLAQEVWELASLVIGNQGTLTALASRWEQQ